MTVGEKMFAGFVGTITLAVAGVLAWLIIGAVVLAIQHEPVVDNPQWIIRVVNHGPPGSANVIEVKDIVAQRNRYFLRSHGGDFMIEITEPMSAESTQ